MIQHLMEAFDSASKAKPHVILVEEDVWMHDGERLTPVHVPTILIAAIRHEAQHALDHKTHAADILITLRDALTLAEMDIR